VARGRSLKLACSVPPSLVTHRLKSNDLQILRLVSVSSLDSKITCLISERVTTVRNTLIAVLLVVSMVLVGSHNSVASANDESSKGATIEFVSGDSVTFLRISLPNGRVIVKEVGKK